MQRMEPDAADDRAPWRTGVVYQIYPRSFADTSGDGLGDLEGITRHLDHLAGSPGSLGVDAIWLSPINPSPGVDLGYDISDYASVDPIFGTGADFDRLVAEAHRRGIKVILDLVVNHTSDAHAWFVASRGSRTGPYANRYLWSDPAGTDRAGRPVPPNNWVSFFGGSAWEWEPVRGQFYEHTFLAQQPDLNWRDPGTRADVTAMMRDWLARGVDGFRMDVFNAFLKDPQRRSNPVRRGRSAWSRQLHVHDKDQPDLPALLAELRAVVDEVSGRMTVGELFDGDSSRAAHLSAERHLVFDFELLHAGWSAAAIGRALDRREAAYGPDRWPTVVLSNHDQPRHVSRWGAGRDVDELARASALLLLTMRGTPFLYYGEELGVPGVVIPNEAAIDPPPAIPCRDSGGGIATRPGLPCHGRANPAPDSPRGTRGCRCRRTGGLVTWRPSVRIPAPCSPSTGPCLRSAEPGPPFIRVAWRASRRPPPASLPSGGGRSMTGRSWS